ncbi:hypothetical protein GC167_05990 [bacterium]|nr:hypothetical protein [bacterium]
MSKVVNIRDARRSKTAPARRKRKVAPQLDPRVKLSDRVFEITTEDVEGEHSFQRRVRIRLAKPGGISKNIARLMRGGDEFVVGQLQHEIGANKWSEAGYGGVMLCSITSFREIVEKVKPVVEVKKVD